MSLTIFQWLLKLLLWAEILSRPCRVQRTKLIQLIQNQLLAAMRCERELVVTEHETLVEIFNYFICDKYTRYEVNYSKLNNYLADEQNKARLIRLLPIVEKALVLATLKS